MFLLWRYPELRTDPKLPTDSLEKNVFLSLVAYCFLLESDDVPIEHIDSTCSTYIYIYTYTYAEIPEDRFFGHFCT